MTVQTSHVTVYYATLLVAVVPALVGGLGVARIQRVLPWIAAASAGAIAGKVIEEFLGHGVPSPPNAVAWVAIALTTFALLTAVADGLPTSRSPARTGAHATGVVSLVAFSLHRLVEATVTAVGAGAGGFAGAAAVLANATHAAVEGSVTASTAAVHGTSRRATTFWIGAASTAPLIGLSLGEHLHHFPGENLVGGATAGVFGYAAARCFARARLSLRIDVLIAVACGGLGLVLITAS